VPWVIDGSNAARGGDRSSVRRAALAIGRAERVRLVVFFDGAPPPGEPDEVRLGAVELRYVAHADGAILRLLGPRGRGWRLVTDDRGLAARARDLGAEVVGTARFWQKAGSVDPGPPSDNDLPGRGAADGVEPLPTRPGRVRRRPGGARRS
jgi:hypothetical protein